MKREYFILNLKMMQEASKRRCNKIKLLSLSFVSKLTIKSCFFEIWNSNQKRVSGLYWPLAVKIKNLRDPTCDYNMNILNNPKMADSSLLLVKIL